MLMGMTGPTPTRRFCPTPAWLICGLLVVEGLLWLSEWYQWSWFNEKKGRTVLIGVAMVGVVLLLMLLWFNTSKGWPNSERCVSKVTRVLRLQLAACGNSSRHCRTARLSPDSPMNGWPRQPHDAISVRVLVLRLPAIPQPAPAAAVAEGRQERGAGGSVNRRR